jgi:hypothetical protein
MNCSQSIKPIPICDFTESVGISSQAGPKREALAPLAIQFLDVHNAKYQLHLLESNAGPADVLLEQVGIIRPRLVVMGAHGEHRLRDLFFDSVTRKVVRACHVPDPGGRLRNQIGGHPALAGVSVGNERGRRV